MLQEGKMGYISEDMTRADGLLGKGFKQSRAMSTALGFRKVTWQLCFAGGQACLQGELAVSVPQARRAESLNETRARRTGGS